MKLLRPLVTVLGLLLAWQALVWATAVPHVHPARRPRVAVAWPSARTCCCTSRGHAHRDPAGHRAGQPGRHRHAVVLASLAAAPRRWLLPIARR